MATLFDLAQQYLNRALPETFKYDRTPRIGIPTPVPSPLPPEPIKKLPVQGGGDNNNLAGSISPMDLSTDFSQITLDRQKRLSQDPTGLNKFLIDNLKMRSIFTSIPRGFVWLLIVLICLINITECLSHEAHRMLSEEDKA